MVKLHPKTSFVGKKQMYLPYCHSTNDIASEIGHKGGFENGTIVFTDFQTAGRGQRGTVWQGDTGKNLMMSLLVDSSFLEVGKQFDLGICMAVSAIEALKRLGVENATIKWPNDVLLGTKKIAGILVENSIKGNKLHFSVLGIGINISQMEFIHPQATSLHKEGYSLINRNLLAETLCEEFETNFINLQNGISLEKKYLDNLLGLKKEQLFNIDDQLVIGKIRGIDNQGQLLLESNHPKKAFGIKEISFVFD